MSKTNLLLLAVVSLLYLACSSSREASTNDSSMLPDWYSGSNAVSSTQTGFMAYGTALAADSSVAAEKAVTKALANLEQHISDMLESVRSDAVEEAGSGSGLDSPAFILALRNAEGGVSRIASESQKQARSNRNSQGFRGFAKITLTRQELIDHLDSELSANQGAWQALKRGLAF